MRFHGRKRRLRPRSKPRPWDGWLRAEPSPAPGRHGPPEDSPGVPRERVSTAACAGCAAGRSSGSAAAAACAGRAAGRGTGSTCTPGCRSCRFAGPSSGNSSGRASGGQSRSRDACPDPGFSARTAGSGPGGPCARSGSATFTGRASRSNWRAGPGTVFGGVRPAGSRARSASREKGARWGHDKPQFR